MIFEEKKIVLKNGKTAVFKTPDVTDAEMLLNYIKKASAETDFLARYPEERSISVEQEEAWLKRLRDDKDTLNITCFIDGEIAGNCEIRFFCGIKTSHRAVVAIAILKDFWNLGIGSAMFHEITSAARERGTEIMELEYIRGNDRAQHLYEKFGFKAVAVKPKVFKLKDGTYQDEIYMQKELI